MGGGFLFVCNVGCLCLVKSRSRGCLYNDWWICGIENFIRWEGSWLVDFWMYVS